jgi:hypothetical protein
MFTCGFVRSYFALAIFYPWFFRAANPDAGRLAATAEELKPSFDKSPAPESLHDFLKAHI